MPLISLRTAPHSIHNDSSEGPHDPRRGTPLYGRPRLAVAPVAAGTQMPGPAGAGDGTLNGQQIIFKDYNLSLNVTQLKLQRIDLLTVDKTISVTLNTAGLVTICL